MMARLSERLAKLEQKRGLRGGCLVLDGRDGPFDDQIAQRFGEDGPPDDLLIVCVAWPEPEEAPLKGG